MPRAAFASPSRLGRPLPLFSRGYARGPIFNPRGVNVGLINALLHSKEEEQLRPDKNKFKLRAFDTAIKVIDSLDFRIFSPSQTKDLPGIGPGILRRIEQYTFEGDAKELLSPEECDRARRRIAAMQELQRIPGLGPVKAKRLIDIGCTSIEDLRKPGYRKELSAAVQSSLDMLDHIGKSVLRSQAESLLEVMRSEVLKEPWETLLVGSYRRGRTTSSDIDILLLHPLHDDIPKPPELLTEESEHLGKSEFTRTRPSSRRIPLKTKPLLGSALKELEMAGIIARTLTSSGVRWQGYVRLPEQGETRTQRLTAVQNLHGEFRKMDLSFVSRWSRGAALLAYTGDSQFNQYIRSEAKKVDMHLDEYGLWRKHFINGSPSGEFLWHRCPAASEESVLEQIGVDFVEPAHRAFSQLIKTKSKDRACKTRVD